ncbi:hypothetical protein C2G38_2029559 [Gigaspora rosea]|uniref:Uncharacterized protein n=1 Tax=Gigaspora rosea TaxID=44941 RepID=A0A397VZJ7_9GLOM|nr:hypothetical protein C2G38_2029559 [Gigaspora rosea]
MQTLFKLLQKGIWKNINAILNGLNSEKNFDEELDDDAQEDTEEDNNNSEETKNDQLNRQESLELDLLNRISKINSCLKKSNKLEISGKAMQDLSVWLRAWCWLGYTTYFLIKFEENSTSNITKVFSDSSMFFPDVTKSQMFCYVSRTFLEQIITQSDSKFISTHISTEEKKHLQMQLTKHYTDLYSNNFRSEEGKLANNLKNLEDPTAFSG